MTSPKRSDSTAGGMPANLAETALKDRALDAAAEGITIADARKPDRPLIYVNQGFERLTGYSRESVLGTNCRFLQGADTDPETVAVIRRAIDEGHECVVELLNYRKDGTPFWNRLSITPITDQVGTVTHFIGVQSDITARKNAEQAVGKTNARLEEINRRFRKDLAMAAGIQNSFLPENPIRIDGLDVAWDLRSCDELAGDTLNALPLDERHVEFYVIDVSGHGVPAALLSVTLNHLLSPSGDGLVLGRSPDGSSGSGIQSPADIVKALNRQFPFDKERNQFFTLVYGIYDKEDRVFSFVSAGHPPLILVSRSGETRLDWSGGVPIGILPDSEYEENSIRLEVGDRVYLYSDGLVEAFGPDEEPFGEERLRRVLAEARGETLAESVQAAIGTVEAWGSKASFKDDVSILAFEVTASE